MLLEKKMIDKCRINDNIITDNIRVNINTLGLRLKEMLKKEETEYKALISLLNNELQVSFGCTEPAAVAYAVSLAVFHLHGDVVENIGIKCSSNIIKNVKSVTVPNTGGLKGIEVAVAAGAVAKRPDLKLEVLGSLDESYLSKIGLFLERCNVEVGLADSDLSFDIHVIAKGSIHCSEIRLAGFHTNVVLIKEDGVTLFETNWTEKPERVYGHLSVRTIVDFAKSVEICDVSDLLDKQISFNYEISNVGLNGEDWGANIGSTLLSFDDSLNTRLKAQAAAGSDARMSGCELPVVINSGSGNQGITVSVPVIYYAKNIGCSKELLYRALVLSNLLAIYQRHGIGCLSAYCGVINAGVAAVCGIAFLDGFGIDAIESIVANGLAIASGVVCDGAKPSCASKIAIGLDSGLIAYEMFRRNKSFNSGDGLVMKNADLTVAAVARLGRVGMRSTDREIMEIMLNG